MSRYRLVSLVLVAALLPVAGWSATPDLLSFDPAAETRRHVPAYVVDEIPVQVATHLIAEPDSAITLATFALSGEQLVSRNQHVWSNPTGSTSWIGSIEGDPSGSVVLVSREGAATGTIRFDGRLFVLRRLPGGQHVVQEIDENSPELREEEPTPVSDDELKPLDAAVASRSTAASTLGGGIPTFDLMVVYTQQAINSAGGTVLDIENRIDLGVTETNLSYMNSNVDLRVNLVHTAFVTYTDSGSISTDRNRLRIKNDGFLDEVHDWRDEYGADIVKLIAGTGGCGIAYIMTTVSPAFEEYAFCVTGEGCISPNYTFAHEMGHIQSARHDYNADSTTGSPFAFNHGYYSPSSVWRTVMSYNNCSGSPCTRSLYWSNPNVLHPSTSEPMGIPDGQPNAADNHLTLNTTASTVVAWRQAPIFQDGFESGDTQAWSLP